MSTIEARTLQGFSDYLPEEMAVRHHVKHVWIRIFRKYGFGELETPALEYAEVLKGKYGEEEKLIYEFEDNGGRKVALRYDQTVPLARVMAQHANEIKLPFKRYEINRVWRADAARRGRKREFYQCDADIVGTSSMLADAEIIALLSEGCNELKLSDHTIFINNRKCVNAFLRTLRIPKEKEVEVIRSMDKLDKIGKEGVKEELEKRGVSEKVIAKILEEISGKHSFEEAREKMKARFKEDDEGIQGVDELEKVFSYLRQMGIPNGSLAYEASLVRGLDYYTGTIFEVFSPKFGRMSLAGGGRYDNLCERFSGKTIPAVGVGIGFEPMCAAVCEQNLAPEDTSPQRVLVTVFSEEWLPKSLETVQKLRKAGIRAGLYLDVGDKLGKQFEYADKRNIPYAVVIGPEEAEKDEYVLKNMKEREQSSLTMEGIVEKLTV